MKKILAFVLLSSWAFGAGYEKTILWGGKYSGLAGSAAAGVKGSDSIYYNPAGLAASAQTVDLTFNLSQASSQVNGPIVPSANVVNPGPTVSAFTYAAKQESGKTISTTLPAITYSMMLTDTLALGLGYYGVGGTRANYEDVDFAPRSFKGKVSSEVTISEFAAGLGYKFSESLRMGLALRYTMTTAAFSAMSYTQSGSNVVAITNLDIKDAKDARLDAVRLGVQYDLNENTKFGLAIRTETKLEAKGKASGTANACANATCAAVVNLSVAEVDANISTVLPMAINLGVEHKLTDSWNLFGELVHTQYSRVDKVVVDGTVTVGSTASEITDIDQKWKDQLNVKLAAEYAGMSWPVRFGYVYTSQVSDAQYARASFTPPGPAATYTLGTGTKCDVSGSPMEFNISMDYTTVKGTGDNSVQPLITPAGNYEATSSGVHTGISYRF